MELLLSAGAPVPEPLLAEVQQLLPQPRLHTPYGMTEALPVTDISLEQIRAAGADAAAGTVLAPATACASDMPVHGARLAIIPLAADGTAPGTSRVTEAGVTGEILVSAPHVKESYDRLWLTQQESAGLPGWHSTGDVGHFDAAGRLWVEGRLAHVVTAPGAVVTPVGAEQAIERLDAVAAGRRRRRGTVRDAGRGGRRRDRASCPLKRVPQRRNSLGVSGEQPPRPASTSPLCW